MTTLSPASQNRLDGCDQRLRCVFKQVATMIDCAILEGHRDQEQQDADYAKGKTQLKWPHGKHNANPSLAVDAAPLPIDWKDRERLSLFAGYVLGTAAAQGITLRWGGDWNHDFKVADNHFDDLVHFEIVEGKLATA